jgi:hypothetical protein
VHRSVPCEHSSYFKNLINQSESRSRHQDQLSIELDISQEACAMLARWLYGQPLCENGSNSDNDLNSLCQIYGFACDTQEEDGIRNKELIDACLDGIKHCFTQRSETLYNPIENLEFLLVEDKKFPGKTIILRQLVYGECASHGRTKTWLEQFCGPSRGHEYRTEIAEMICMEFAKKACEQSQSSSSTTNSASTTN